MPTVKELKQLCKEKNIELYPHWNKEQIISEIFDKTGILIKKTDEEIKKEKKKNENHFIRCLVHDVAYLTRKEFIEIHGKDYVEDIEKHYGKFLRYRIPAPGEESDSSEESGEFDESE